MTRNWEAYGGPFDGRFLGRPYWRCDTLYVPFSGSDVIYRVNWPKLRYDYVSPGVLPALGGLTEFRVNGDEP